MVQFTWQDDPGHVSKFLCACSDVICFVLTLMIRVRHMMSPRWLEKM